MAEASGSSGGEKTSEVPPDADMESEKLTELNGSEHIVAEEQEKLPNGEVESTSGTDIQATPAASASAQKKKSKKKKKGKKAQPQGQQQDVVDSGDSPLGTAPVVNASTIRQIQKAMEQFMITDKPARTPEEAVRKKYAFWETQPVLKFGDSVEREVNEPVEPDKEKIRQDPYTLPAGFKWNTLDIGDEVVFLYQENEQSRWQKLRELYTLLNENYVEDDDNMFRFDYSANFLLWALRPPCWNPNWHCGVRVSSNNKLVGFISAVPAKIKIRDRQQDMVEINFLCVHKKLRSKRMAPVLIKEITRRVNLEGIFQAVYTAGIVLPKPVATCRYWHRSLNPKKLIEVKFSHLGKNMTMQRTLKLYRLPEHTKTPGLRPMCESDVKGCHKLLSEYLSKFDLAPVFTVDEFHHWFSPRDGIVDSYVVAGQGGKITDMISFYTLPSTIMHNPSYKTLKAAYSFYNVGTSTPWYDLMQDALVLAKQNDFDVFNALDLMDNKEFLEKLKFGIGDGNLNYYLYNWKCPEMTSEQVGLVLQ